jgi:hypothetical protein
MPLRGAAAFRQKPFCSILPTACGGGVSPETVLFFHATARGGGVSPETVPTGFRHLPAGRRFALHP